MSKLKKYSCRKLDNTRACKGPKDVFDFRWAEIPLVTSQQRWRNQNGGRSELSEVISRVKMRLYRIKDLWSIFGIYSIHIKQNCSIFGFTCPLNQYNKMNLQYNISLLYFTLRSQDLLQILWEMYCLNSITFKTLHSHHCSKDDTNILQKLEDYVKYLSTSLKFVIMSRYLHMQRLLMRKYMQM